MTDTDTSVAAVERLIEIYARPYGNPTVAERFETVEALRALLTERNAAQARAERAEAALQSMLTHVQDEVFALGQGEVHPADIGPSVTEARATLAQIDAEPAGCDCESSNQPDTTGNIPETILDPRPYFDFTTKTVCVDACIAEQIEALWRAGVWTRGCCCGHNKRGPEVFLDRAEDARKAAEVLAGDSREWKIMIWAGNTRYKTAGFATTGAEERWREDVENACPHCGGSGHKGDVSEPAGVKVKPLEWKDNKASTPFGDYSIHQTPDGYEVIDPEGEEIVHVGFNSDPIRSAYRLAQEFVQADYEQRILAALEPDQTHREGWKQAKEAAAEICDKRANEGNGKGALFGTQKRSRSHPRHAISGRQRMTQKAPERIWAFLTNDADDPGHMFGSCWTRERDDHEPYVPEDHHKAAVAAAYEDARNATNYVSIHGPVGIILLNVEDYIRARTPDDATEALEARDESVKREARNNALREAASVIGAKVGHNGDVLDCRCGSCVARRKDHSAILALITEDQSDGE
ncbi:hypothetical protein [Roseovarius sp. MMSF_3281]|uniref:hypothetical protein n=1 Tax=Roseovarius sp. MMSF_3281 TaxID=3046694 RepID=UPI00273E4F16|nr:hypothetical protein [Roseovarius sp. MMSF_3281]